MTEPAIVYTGVEPSVDDVIAYTGGRLADDDETARQLAAALAAVRTYCGWHVAPVVVGDMVTVDGGGRRVLELPTGRLLELTALTEDGATLDVDDDIYWSADGLVRKKSNAYWSNHYRAITATMTHGYEPVPADWVAAVLTVVDRMSMNVGLPGPAATAGPYSVQFASPGAALTPEICTMLEPYRLAGVF